MATPRANQCYPALQAIGSAHARQAMLDPVPYNGWGKISLWDYATCNRAVRRSSPRRAGQPALNAPTD